MVNSRVKGSQFERDIVNALRLDLGDIISTDLHRNLEQTRDGGCDIVIDGLWAVECKRYAKGNWYAEAWLEQCYRQANKINMIPMLVWKYDRQPLRVTMPLYAIGMEFHFEEEHGFPTEGNAVRPITMDWDTAMLIVRESL